uniref:Perilipin-5 n=1 Tax=Eptatretus burgeri TaxID=7764 RepID=A0A8C4NET8_EPTBU
MFHYVHGGVSALQAGGDAPNSVVQRLIGLPLLSSAYGELVAVYLNGKEARPILRSLCNVAEQSISGMTAIAATGSRPFTRLLQPQST